MEERDYYAEVRAILEDWIEAESIERDELREELEDIISYIAWDEE